MDSEDQETYGKSADPAGADVTFLRGAVPAPEPLPRGQHDLSPEYVARHQRSRIQEATTFVLAERGYGAATIGDIVARAHVSRRTFYAHFDSKEHCVLATFGAASECIADAVRTAYTQEAEWDAAVAAGLGQLMHVLVEYPQTARTCFLEIRSVGAMAAEPIHAAHMMCIDALRSAVNDRAGAPAVGDLALEMGMGGLVTVIRARLTAGDPAALQRELPEIAAALLAPLVGDDATRAVVERLDAAPGVRAAHAI
ncbi:MAG TPA: helix-turn-helix domain-containing protein [Thermoleophilaceae bacterium]|nr:helix-turn-helix domain-containing protein [Thermoleophilaceae bacterium]